VFEYRGKREAMTSLWGETSTHTLLWKVCSVYWDVLL